MKTNPTKIFDRRLLSLRMERARRIGAEDASFLLERVAEDMVDRLAVTMREFERAVDLMTPSPLLRERIASARPGLVIEAVDGIAANGDLRLGQESCDFIFSALALHRLDDLPGALAQIRRALRPDGLFMAAVPGEGTLAELRHAAIAAETSLRGGAALRVEPMADVRQFGALLQRAGFALPVTDIDHVTLRYRDVASLVADLRAMGATSVLAERPPALPGRFPAALEEAYREAYAHDDGRIPASFSLIHLTGWAPHESQQKPLRPGSAAASLKDALAAKDSGKNK